jgi:hypothetical protein
MAPDQHREIIMIRIKQVGPWLVIVALIAGLVGSVPGSAKAQQKPVIKAPATCDAKLINRLLEVIEKDIVPLTQAGVKKGNKVFGAAIIKKSDLAVVIAATNNATENPLWHAEVHALKRFTNCLRKSDPTPRN